MSNNWRDSIVLSKEQLAALKGKSKLCGQAAETDTGVSYRKIKVMIPDEEYRRDEEIQAEQESNNGPLVPIDTRVPEADMTEASYSSCRLNTYINIC